MPVEKINAGITGVGACIPERILTNRDLSAMVDTSDEWIKTMTGISERHIADQDQASSDLGAAAAEKALTHAGISRDEVDLIIVGTMSPDMPLPATACIIQHKLGMKETPAFDVTAGCSAFTYAMSVGNQFIASGAYRTVLVIGTDVTSKIVNWQDRASCIVAGDGAGAVVLQPAQKRHGILYMHLGADGSGAELLCIPAGGSRAPVTVEDISANRHKIRMDGHEIFKFAMVMLPRIIDQAIKSAGIKREEVSLIIPHQANVRIIEAAARMMDISMERFMINVDRYGNTSSASIPIALCEALKTGRIKKNDIVVLTGFGGGLTWGTVVIRW